MDVSKYIKKYKWSMIVAFVCKVIEAICELCIPVVVALIIDKGISTNDMNYIWTMIIVLFSLTIGGYGFALVCQYYASVSSQKVATDLRLAVYKHIQSISQENIENIKVSSLINRVTNDIISVQQMIALTLRLASRLPFLIIGSLIACYIISDSLFLIFIIATIILFILIVKITTYSIKKYHHIQSTNDKIVSSIHESLTGMQVIRAFGIQDYQIENYNHIIDGKLQIQNKVINVQSLLQPGSYLLINVASLVVIYFGGKEITFGTLSQGDVVALINYLTQISMALFVLVNLLSLYFKSITSYKRVNEVLQLPAKEYQVKRKEASHLLEVDNITFGYHSHPVIKDISFTLDKGKQLAIIGPTSSGKSTIVNILMAIYKQQHGNVWIDGFDNQTIEPHELSKLITYVSQSPALFNGTLIENVCISNNNQNDVGKILKQSQAFSFVSKKGYTSKVEQNGKNLSGGQIQRIAIARALYSGSKIIVFDEAFSALDSITTRKIQQAITQEKLTSVIVSKKVSVVKHADEILYVETGQVIGRGSHQELYINCLPYKELCDLQGSEISYE